MFLSTDETVMKPTHHVIQSVDEISFYLPSANSSPSLNTGVDTQFNVCGFMAKQMLSSEHKNGQDAAVKLCGMI